MEICPEDLRKSPKEERNRARRLWPWNRSARVARIAEEDVQDRVSSFDESVGCIQQFSGSNCKLRAKTPWSPSASGSNVDPVEDMVCAPGEIMPLEACENQDSSIEHASDITLSERSRSPFEKDSPCNLYSASGGGPLESPPRSKRNSLLRLGLRRKASTSDQSLNDDIS